MTTPTAYDFGTCDARVESAVVKWQCDAKAKLLLTWNDADGHQASALACLGHRDLVPDSEVTELWV